MDSAPCSLAWILLKSRPEEIGLRATIIVSQSSRLSILPSFRKVQCVVPESKIQIFDPSNLRHVQSDQNIIPIDDFEEGKRHGDEINHHQQSNVTSVEPEGLQKVDENRQPVEIIEDLDIEEIT